MSIATHVLGLQKVKNGVRTPIYSIQRLKCRLCRGIHAFEYIIIPKTLCMQLRKSLFFLLVSWLLTAGTLKANSGRIPVEANENTTVSLFFPSPISKVIEPAAHFSFKREPDGNLATLSAKKGNPKNLTVITEDGDIFSFALNYSEIIQNFTFMISPEQAIGKRGGATAQRREAPKGISNSPEPDTIISDDATMGTFQTEEGDETQLNLAEENVVEEARILSENFRCCTNHRSFWSLETVIRSPMIHLGALMKLHWRSTFSIRRDPKGFDA